MATRPPRQRIRGRDDGSDVLQQRLVDVRAAEGGVAPPGQHRETRRAAGASLHHTRVHGPASEVEHGQRRAVGSHRTARRDLAEVEQRRGDGLGHQQHPTGQTARRSVQHPGADRAPARGMGEHQLIHRGAARQPPGLAEHPGEHRPHHVGHGEHGVTEQQLPLVDPPFGVRLVARRVDRGLPLGLLTHEHRAGNASNVTRLLSHSSWSGGFAQRCAVDGGIPVSC